MKRKKQLPLILACLAAALSFAISIYFYFGVVGYIFSAQVFLLVTLLILFFIVISLLSKKYPKPARITKIIATWCIAFALIAFAIAEAFVISASRGDSDPKADYIIVLGAGLNGSVPSYSLTERLVAAYNYLEKYPEALVVVSGGQGPGEDITEAQAMSFWLQKKGIDSKRIIKEEKSTSTLENLAFSKAILESMGKDTSKRIAIVTSEYHIYRALEYAKSLGLDPIGVPAKTSFPMLRINYYARESCGVLYMWVFGFDKSAVYAMAKMHALSSQYA